MIDKTNQTILKYWPLLGLLGIGGVGGGTATFAPLIVGGLMDQMRVVTVIMCNHDDKCIDKAWAKMLERKALSEAKTGR